MRPSDTGSSIWDIYIRMLLDNTNWDGHYGTNMNRYQMVLVIWGRPGTSYSAAKGPVYNIELFFLLMMLVILDPQDMVIMVQYLILPQWLAPLLIVLSLE